MQQEVADSRDEMVVVEQEAEAAEQLFVGWQPASILLQGEKQPALCPHLHLDCVVVEVCVYEDIGLFLVEGM